MSSIGGDELTAKLIGALQHLANIEHPSEEERLLTLHCAEALLNRYLGPPTIKRQVTLKTTHSAPEKD